MSNKLQEILNEWRTLLDHGPIPEKVKDALVEVMKDKLVEYTRSLLTIKYPYNPMTEEANGWNAHVGVMKARIDQDLQSLTSTDNNPNHIWINLDEEGDIERKLNPSSNPPQDV